MKPDPVKQKIQELLLDMVPDAKYMGMPPITLSTVLRAIENTITHHCIFVSASGRFYEERAGQEVQLMAGKWNLSLDNYDQQSEETKQFIGSLLGV